MPTEGASSPRLADGAAGLVGAYVHIPFCRRICPYCDFAVVEGTGLADRYVAAVAAEIAATQPFDRPLDAVAFGGGTPTSLEPAVLGRLVEGLADRFGLAADAEVSIEANPEDLSSSIVSGLADAGFNRISLGVQSYDDEVLASLGRSHSATQAAAAVECALEGIGAVNVDLIFGTPGESMSVWEGSVRCAIDSGAGHVSTYALTVERGTPLSRRVAAGAAGPDEDLQADEYELAAGMLAPAGFARYETSNYAREGEASVYNLLTWAQGEYAGFGNGAHRHRGGARSWNVRRVDRYVERLADGGDATVGEERLGDWQREVERVMLGLRRTAGVVAGRAGAALVASVEGRRLLDSGILVEEGDRIRVGRPLLGDLASRPLLALSPPDC